MSLLPYSRQPVAAVAFAGRTAGNEGQFDSIAIINSRIDTGKYHAAGWSDDNGKTVRPAKATAATGWRDVRGCLWFCGRKSQRVVTENGTLYTVPCESVFLNHPMVKRAALVGLGEPGHMTPVIVIEPEKKFRNTRWDNFVTELLALARANPRTRTIKTFLRKLSFPLDIRHNAKISREKLAVWARRELSSKNLGASDYYRL